jgi:hypothetical protein
MTLWNFGAEIRGERRRPAHQEDRTQRDTHAQESQAPEPRQSHRGLQAGPAHFAVNLNCAIFYCLIFS